VANPEERNANYARQSSRRLALQALYQCQFTQNSVKELVEQYENDEYWKKADQDYFAEMIKVCLASEEKFDAIIDGASDYKVAQIDHIELASLRIAVYEYCHSLFIPENVIIAEAIRLCKRFGADEGYKFVNAILDNICKTQNRLTILQ